MAWTWRYRVVLLSISFSVAMRWMMMDAKFPSDSLGRLQSSELIRTSDDFIGPESLAFDPQGKGPYVGVADGRVMVWENDSQSWSYFAHTSPLRSDVCNPGSPAVLKVHLEHICGRPLGLRFEKNGNLYIADAYYGLNVVGPEGGLSKALVTEVDGARLKFTNDLDIDDNGIIYFTDSSSKYHRREYVYMFMGGDTTGRLLSFTPSTGETKVLVQGLQFPNGLALNQDKTFLVISETLTRKILRYWLGGPKAGKLEFFANVPGSPDNLSRTKDGDFWVAIHARPNVLLKMPLLVRQAVLKLPLQHTAIYNKIVGRIAKGLIVRLSPNGNVSDVLEDKQGGVVKLISEVEERNGNLWMGSVVLPQIAIYKKE